MSEIKVVLADDHVVLRAGLRALLEAEMGIEVVGEASTGDEAVDLARELRPLALTAEGYSAKEIGEKLFISPKTVDTYRSRIMEKLGLNHRAEIVRFALRAGLLEGTLAAPLNPVAR